MLPNPETENKPDPWKYIALVAIVFALLSMAAALFSVKPYASARSRTEDILVTELVYATIPPPTSTITMIVPTGTPTSSPTETPIPTLLAQDDQYHWERIDMSDHKVTEQTTFIAGGLRGWCQGIVLPEYKALGADCYLFEHDYQRNKIPDFSDPNKASQLAYKLNEAFSWERPIGTLDRFPRHPIRGEDLLSGVLTEMRVYILSVNNPPRNSKLHLLTANEQVALEYMDWTATLTLWEINGKIYYEVPLFTKQKLVPYSDGFQLQTSTLTDVNHHLADTYLLIIDETMPDAILYLASFDLNVTQDTTHVTFEVLKK